jgi:hypothetical protein
MSVITTIIAPQSFEIVRDRIGEILADELHSQWILASLTTVEPTVWTERFVPFDKEELPVVNVSLEKGDYSNQDVLKSDGTYRFNIDCYTRAASTDTEAGDVLAVYKLHRLSGLCRAILEHTKYKTLGFVPPFIMNRHIESISLASPADAADATSVVMDRMVLVVRVPEYNGVFVPNLIAGYETSVKLDLTDRGYVWTNPEATEETEIFDNTFSEQFD